MEPKLVCFFISNPMTGFVKMTLGVTHFTAFNTENANKYALNRMSTNWASGKGSSFGGLIVGLF